MVDWHDPAVIILDYFNLTKLLHVLGGAYIWETVMTAGFELDVLRGKQPYRWTIWIYLGTRYSCLLMFIIFFIHNDSGHVPCQPFIIANYALSYVSWAFASLIIVLRIIAIWDRNIIVSLIALSTLLAGLGLNIRTLTKIESTYNSAFEACLVLKTDSGLVGAAAILAADIMLLMIMLIGLLRHAHGSSIGIRNLLYKQCIIWIVLAAVVEIPPLVFYILDLNDAWNQMFSSGAVAFLSVCAARMYRSLSKHGSLTEYLSDPPPFSAGLPFSNYRRREAHDVHTTIHFRTAGTATQSDRTANEPFMFVPAEQIHLESVPGASNTTLVVPGKTKSKDIPVYRLSWHRPG
ncbi:hypothetical protein EDB89DRAFT_685629 [Lactarius sanguifluus]|nr:hypothetical protein EDB89DRAFT_685629 [Lactarius sanguifluus]